MAQNWIIYGEIRKKVISEYVPKLQKFLNRKNNLSIIIMNNPFYTWLAILLVENQVGKQVRSQVENQIENQVRSQVENQIGNQVRNQVWKQVRSQVRSQVENQVENQVRSQVENQIENQVWNQVRNQVRNQVWNQVENQVRNQVWKQVENQVENQVGKQVENFIWPYLDGNFASGYFSFNDYMFENVLKIKHEYQEFWEIYKMSSQFSLIYPLENFIVFCEKPIKINMKNSTLHCDNAPAIQYADDFNIYCLNGVRVTKEIVETSAYDLNPKLVLTEKNAEIRREIVRKIGIERICQKLKTKTINKWNEYELLELPKIEGMTIKNQSILK